MKRFYLIILLGFTFSILQAQRFTDYGVLLGGSYYNGQINPTKLFYKTRPSFGGFFRLNIDKRHAVRLSGYYARLYGNDADFTKRVLVERAPTEFALSLMDYSAQFEYNFLPYMSGRKKFANTFYVAAGLGYSLALSSDNTFNIPFGIGSKFNITDRLSAGLEWSFRKTLTDNLDNVQSPMGSTLINNNDWYSIAGLFISYKFVKFAVECPAYN